MLSEDHARAQQIADNADVAMREGDLARAETFYSEAANLERRAFDDIPSAKKRTLGVMGVSVAALLYKANRFSEAETFVTSLLSDYDLLPSARHELEEVLRAIPLTLSIAVGGGVVVDASALPPVRPPLAFADRIVRELRETRNRALTASDVESHYIEYRTLLISIAAGKFRIPGADAESLVQDVFVDLMQLPPVKGEIRPWLVTCMTRACADYWRRQDRMINDLPNMVTGGSEELTAMRMTIRQAMTYLEPRCREAIYLYFIEGRTAEQAAVELEMPLSTTQKLIYRCRDRLKEIVYTIMRRTDAT